MWNFDIEERKEFMDSLASQIKSCNKCSLCSERNEAVPGEGPVTAKVFIIGESPGEEEDKSGIPFIGKSGELLNKTLDYIKIPRDKVFVTNVVKCKPKNNKSPESEEILACSSYLNSQLRIIEPHVIITLGIYATKFMIGSSDKKITQIIEEDEYFIRSNGDWKFAVVPAFHPSYLLKNRELIKPSSDSLKQRILKSMKDLKRKIEK